MSDEIQQVNMDAIDGNNGASQATDPEPQQAEVSRPSLQERLQAGEAKRKAVLEAAAAPTAETVKSPDAAATATPKEGNKTEAPQQFKKPDGTVDETKLDKSTQHLEKSLEEKLAKYKELQRKFTQVSQETAKAEKAAPAAPAAAPQQAAPAPMEIPDGFEAFKQRLGEGLRSEDPNKQLETLAESFVLAAQFAEQRVAQKLAEEKRQAEMLSKLDQHAKANPWVYDDKGFQAIQEVLINEPALMKTRDPYGVAIALLKDKFQADNAVKTSSPGPKTPILGASGAVPPSVSEPVSDGKRLEQLKNELLENRGNSSKQATILREMDKVRRQMLGLKK